MSLATVLSSASTPQPAAAHPGLQDLGTLGGLRSAAAAVDGDIVVGWADTAANTPHAFAYDRSAPEADLVDLGTLGGSESEAVAVSGSVVVGHSQVAGDEQVHAFAYDLSAPEDGMRDLGTLGGGSSAAVAIDGSRVVGWSHASAVDDTRHAVAFDLSDPAAALTDLGPGEAVDVSGPLVAVADGLTGYLHRFDGPAPGRIDLVVETDGATTGAVPVALDGSRVVGWAWTETPEDRSAFVYDLARPELGVQTDVFADVAGVDHSTATAVGGGLVAASGEAISGERVLVRDVADPLATPRNLGAGLPAAVSGTVVVGRTAADAAFMADLSVAKPSLVPLGAPPGPSEAVDVDGTAVVGSVTVAGRTRAASWTLPNESVITVLSPESVTWRSSAHVRATLTTTGSTDGVAGAALRLLTRPLGSSTWRHAASATTDGNGRATFSIQPTVNVDLKIAYAGGHQARPRDSEVRRLTVRPRVTAGLTPRRIDPGKTAQLSGTVSPVTAGRRVWLQAFTTTGWANVRSVVVGPSGEFSFRLRPAAGWHSYRAFVRPNDGRGSGESRLRALRVEKVTPVSPTLGRLPNVVVIVTDDQRPETMRHMKHVQSLLVRKGVNFTDAMVPTALCCPSRATILTGRYSHNTAVYSNGGIDGPRVGGWWAFHRAGNESRNLAVALSARGYRTGLVGKYLNYFSNYAPPHYSPPGWDTFLATTRTHGSYYHYALTNGERFGSKPADYSTDVYATRAERFIRRTAAGRPLFLYFTPYAPHSPYTPAPRHKGAWEGKVAAYKAPSTRDDLVGKPAYLRGTPPIPPEEVHRIRTGQKESLMAVDEAVARLVKALRETGRLHNTLVVFTSDNGFLWGDHNLLGKDKPYTPALRIPMVLRWDGHITPGRTDTRFALNVDLATTIARATGTPYTGDGLSLMGAHRRPGFLLEAAAGYHGRPAYCGWRTRGWMYARYATGEQELYDLTADPHELHNLAGSPGVAGRLEALRALAMQHCRPVPPGFSW